MCKHEGGCTCKDDPYGVAEEAMATGVVCISKDGPFSIIEESTKMNTIADFMDLVKDPDPELVSIDDVVKGIEEIEHSFGFIDTTMDRVYGDPFNAVAKIEVEIGAPLAVCADSTTVIPPQTMAIFPIVPVPKAPTALYARVRKPMDISKLGEPGDPPWTAERHEKEMAEWREDCAKWHAKFWDECASRRARAVA